MGDRISRVRTPDPHGPGSGRFLAARSPLDHAGEAAATIIGVPYDRTASYRRGSRLAPAAIRHASQSIESYSPVLDRDLQEIVVVDDGDLEVEALAPEVMVHAVARAAAGARGLPILLGGDHTLTAGAVRAASDRHPGLRVLVLDAHLDLREEYEGNRWSHATAVRRAAEVVGLDRVAVLGVRSGTRDEFALGASLLAASGILRVLPGLWGALEAGPVYLSLDIDVADPSAAPGTGNPEPGGPSAEALIDFMRVLGPLRVVGLDVVEVSPPYDPSGRTAVLAALIVREAALTWAPAGAPA